MAEAKPIIVKLGDRCDRSWAHSIPSLAEMLATAKTARENPESLSPVDIENLAKVVLIHYAAMGVS